MSKITSNYNKQHIRLIRTAAFSYKYVYILHLNKENQAEVTEAKNIPLRKGHGVNKFALMV